MIVRISPLRRQHSFSIGIALGRFAFLQICSRLFGVSFILHVVHVVEVYLVLCHWNVRRIVSLWQGLRLQLFLLETEGVDCASVNYLGEVCLSAPVANGRCQFLLRLLEISLVSLFPKILILMRKHFGIQYFSFSRRSIVWGCLWFS